jgi:small subunit ribosomal protein S1
LIVENILKTGDTDTTEIAAGGGAQDYDAVGMDSAQAGKQTEDFSELLKGYEPVEVGPRSIVQGTVISIDQTGAWVDLGAKCDAFLPAEDVSGAELAIGQVTNFSVAYISEEDGEIHLSLHSIKAWSEVEALCESHAIGEATITALSKKKGSNRISGVVAKIKGLQGFIPGSQLVCPNKVVVGAKVAVKVLKANPVKRELILSQREAQKELESEVLDQLEVGQFVTGTVKALVAYGAFVDVGAGLTGLLHNSEIGADRMQTANNVLSVGQKVELVVVSINRAKRQVSFSLSQVQKVQFIRSIQPGQLCSGRVTRIMAYGAFVEVSDGVTGLLHISELPKRVRNPQELLEVGQTIEVAVLTANEEDGKLALTMKQQAKS